MRGREKKGEEPGKPLGKKKLGGQAKLAVSHVRPKKKNNKSGEGRRMKSGDPISFGRQLGEIGPREIKA